MRAYLELLRVEVTAFHPLQLALQRLVSVALFLVSRRTVVNRHPALWSPDLPLAITITRLPATA